MVSKKTLARRLAVLALALVPVFGVVPAAQASPLASPAGNVADAPADAVASLETHFLDLLNADRQAHGLEPLQFDTELASVARWRSEDMAQRDYFSHDIGGYMVFQVLKDRGIAYRVAGENLAYNTHGANETAPAAERALMASPTHRDNILRADYTHVGVGVAVGPDGKYLYTQLFKAAWEA
ncbi:MAG TPA: CAP domain-containing protein [Chloroflexota bacterium]|nr:CAP domain-containing protein [Chloroflexota bacterium]